MTHTLTAVDLDAAAAALRGYGAPDLPHHAIADAVASDPDIAALAREHGWADGEVVDKLWAVVCVNVLGISFTEQVGRYLSRPQELADDVEAAVSARQVAR
ncbi:hypothetical protein GCM10011608_10860 [Micromonospora sonchi]|uniref:Uncharacterized protein n=1 Tax=Micromonospora sonchi TaxID=1763543 RepID=A0A917TMC6_9ACTN|nr:hypothetical protein [Micromonospora sonchi]GGM27864.1 hypothetical protein GCM10011608_10860 [Micromonospora sonchi]